MFVDFLNEISIFFLRICYQITESQIDLDVNSLNQLLFVNSMRLL